MRVKSTQDGIKVGDILLTNDEARQLIRDISNRLDPPKKTYGYDRLTSDLARIMYPRSWSDHGAVYDPNTALSIAKTVIQKMRQSGWTLVKLRQGDFPV